MKNINARLNKSVFKFILNNMKHPKVFVLVLTLVLLYIIIMIGSYVFSALALQKIGKELNYKNTWFAWVPFLNMVMLMELGDQKWWLLLIPIVNTIFLIVATMKLTKKRGYDEVLGLIILTGIGAYILYYLLAWKPKNTDVNTVKAETVS